VRPDSGVPESLAIGGPIGVVVVLIVFVLPLFLYELRHMVRQYGKTGRTTPLD